MNPGLLTCAHYAWWEIDKIIQLSFNTYQKFHIFVKNVFCSGIELKLSFGLKRSKIEHASNTRGMQVKFS